MPGANLKQLEQFAHPPRLRSSADALEHLWTHSLSDLAALEIRMDGQRVFAAGIPWFVALFGDGHQPAVDPNNPDIVYAQWQQGNLTRYDRRTGETTYIKPQAGEGEEPDRYNWDSPILISPHAHTRLYFGSNRLHRSDDRGDSWTAISPDLTRDIDRYREQIMERVWSIDAIWDLGAMSV